MRHQLPVHSPVSWGALASGLGAAVGGDHGGALERRVGELLKERYSAKDVLFTDSGTSALSLAIEGAVGESGRPVALPGYSCYDLATAVLGARARAVLYDLDPRTLGPDADSLGALRELDPAAVVYAPSYGFAPSELVEPMPLGDALMIVDAAQGVGTEVAGRPLAALGSVAVLSFGRGKGMTGGGGGALLAHDERGLAVVERGRVRLGTGRAPRGSGRLAALAAQLVLGRPGLYAIPSALPFLHLGETLYHPAWPPSRCAASSLAVLERVMPAAEREAVTRRVNAERLSASVQLARGLDALVPAPVTTPGYLRLPVLARRDSRRARLTLDARRLGIVEGYPTTLADLPALTGSLVGPRAPLNGCGELARSLLTLPTHSLLTESDLGALERWLRLT